MRKKLLSLALALVMCLGLTVPAMAAAYTEVVPCKYAQVGDFSEGLAAVAIQVATNKYGDGIFRWGFIDKTGKEVVPCKYTWINGPSLMTSTGYNDENPRFSEGLAVVVVDDGTEYEVNNYRGKCCFIDQTGKEVIPAKYDTASNFSEGLAMVGVYNSRYTNLLGTWYNFTCGFIDKTGKEVVPCKYDAAHPFSEGLAAVRVGNDSATWKWGFIDKTGKEVISPRRYRTVSDFSDGLARVENQGLYGYIDQTGKEVIPCQYSDAGDFSDGLASVYVGEFPGGKYGFIDKTGKMVIPAEFNNEGSGAHYSFSEGMAAVEAVDRRGCCYIDKTGREVFSTRYLVGTKNFSEGFAAVTQGYNRWGFIDKAGNEVVPCQYAEASSVSEGMAAVAVVASVDEHYNRTFKWGFICLGDAPVVEPEKPAEPEQPTMAADSDLVIENGVLTKYVGPGGNVVLPSSVTSIGSGAFNLCWKLTSVTIPDSVTSIGDQAFSKCGGLKSVTISNSVTSIGVEAFSGCMSLTSVTIPDSVTSIGRYAFGGCESLKSVTIGNGVTSIGNEAFRGCGLTSVTIPDSVTSIGISAFYGCKGLASVTIGRGVTSTGSDTFSGCSGLKSVVIPSNVTNIESSAFNSCTGLTSVTISSSVTSIGEFAFNYCYKLKDVYYGETEDQWKAIQIEDFNSSLTGATIHYNSAIPEQDTPTTVGNFTDVKTGDWFAEPVKWAVEKNITAGTSATTFSPNQNCTTAQILSFLWRANGSPKPSGSNPFSDVKSGDYYAEAAVWAYEKGMVSGKTFNGNTPCTRSMAVTYMWKAAGSPSAKTSSFTDVPANADYAQAVAWAVEQGITSGTGNGQFSPASTCTRGQIVTFLYRAFAK